MESDKDYIGLYFFHNKFIRSKFKLCIVFMIISFILYQLSIRYVYSTDSCQWLLNDGRYHGLHVWQPYGCMINLYTRYDARNCIMRKSANKLTKIVFIGDIRIKMFYSMLVKYIHHHSIDDSLSYHFSNVYKDMSINLDMSYIEAPIMDSSFIKILENISINQIEPTTLYIMSSGYQNIEHATNTEMGIKNFFLNLSKAVSFLNIIGRNNTLLWMMQESVYEPKLNNSLQMVTNKLIDTYNSIVLQLLNKVSIHIWKSSRLLNEKYIQKSIFGISPSFSSLKIYIQIFLNFICNKTMKLNGDICCSSKKALYQNNMEIMAVTLISVLLFSLFFNCARLNSLQKYSYLFDKINIFLNNTTKLLLILLYIIICDSSSLFMKENKYFTPLRFFLPLTYFLVVGSFFTEKLTSITIDKSSNSLMSRQKTNELKGWMQSVLLISYITGASQKISLLIFNNILSTAFLILFGYVHFTYYWTTLAKHRNYSHLQTIYTLFVRSLAISFRYNILAVILALILHHPYQFYTFMPLITFWYIIIFLFFLMPPYPFLCSPDNTKSKNSPINNNMLSCDPIEGSIGYYYHLFTVTKFIILGLLITLLYSSEILFYKSFSILPFHQYWLNLNVLDYPSNQYSRSVAIGTIPSWWETWSQNRYSVWIGMLFGYFYKSYQNYIVVHNRKAFNKHYTRVNDVPHALLLNFEDENNCSILYDDLDLNQAAHKSSFDFVSYFKSNSSHGAKLSRLIIYLLIPSFAIAIYVVVMTVSCRGIIDPGKLDLDTFETQNLKQYNTIKLDNCKEINSYIAWIPVISYILLRNNGFYIFSTEHYSSIFSFLGSFSLELYCIQHHIWQTASHSSEGGGVLIFLPNYPTLNLILTAFICICAAHELHHILLYFEHLIFYAFFPKSVFILVHIISKFLAIFKYIYFALSYTLHQIRMAKLLRTNCTFGYSVKLSRSSALVVFGITIFFVLSIIYVYN